MRAALVGLMALGQVELTRRAYARRDPVGNALGGEDATSIRPGTVTARS